MYIFATGILTVPIWYEKYNLSLGTGYTNKFNFMMTHSILTKECCHLK